MTQLYFLALEQDGTTPISVLRVDASAQTFGDPSHTTLERFLEMVQEHFDEDFVLTYPKITEDISVSEALERETIISVHNKTEGADDEYTFHYITLKRIWIY